MTLTREQSAVVTSAETYIHVNAVPGCGKTHTAIACVKHWVLLGVPEKNILVLSFSNVAVNDFKNRLAIPKVCVQTVHALGFSLSGKKRRVMENHESDELLREAIDLVAEPADEVRNVRQALQVRSGRALKSLRSNVTFIRKAISVARARSVSLITLLNESPDFDILKAQGKLLELVEKRFQALKVERELTHFDDMVNEKVSSVMAKDFHWTHVIVDEAQDCSQGQAKMIAGLCKRKPIQAFRSFGDSLQAVFGFAGNGGANFEDFFDCKAMAINRTHRLTRPNAALAMRISGRGKQRIRSSRSGQIPQLIHSEWNELGPQIYGRVRRHLESNPKATVAILARTKAQLRGIDQALRAQGLWATTLNATRLSKELRCVLEACHWLAGNEKPVRNAAASLVSCLERLNINFKGVTKQVKTYLIQAWGSSNLEARFGLVIKAYIALKPKDEIVLLRNDLRLWLPLARQHNSARSMWNALLATKEERVMLSTVHSAKGREWDHVMVLGVTEGLLPIYHALNEGGKLAEERRVMYVAVTRARETLQLFHTPTRHPCTGALMVGVSRYAHNARDLLACES